jgi:hypothetical protein
MAMCLLAQINPLDPRDSNENWAAQLHHARQVCGIVVHTKDRGVASVAIRSLAIASAVLTDRPEQDEVLGILNRISKETGWRLGNVLADLKRTWGWEGATASLTLAPINTAAAHSHSHTSHHHHHLGSSNNNTSRTTTTSTSTSATSSRPGPPPPLFFASQQQSQSQPEPQYQQQQQPRRQQPNAAIPTTPSPPPTSQSVAAPIPTRSTVNPLLANADFNHQDHPYQNYYEPPNSNRGSSTWQVQTQQGQSWPG